MARLLITGASGLLGANLVLEARAEHQITAVAHRHPIAFDGVGCLTQDLSRPGAAAALVRETRPEWIVHCAAAADVDRCEADPDWAMRLNADLPERMAEAAAAAGARLVHISTDAVFDGDAGDYRESDVATPVNVYGRSKLAGERAVLQRDPSATVLRTNFFGWHPRGQGGLAEWFLSCFEAGNPAPGFGDVRVAPILVTDLAQAILTIAALPLPGIYHLTGSECVSKYEFGRRLAREFGFDETAVQPAAAAEAGLRAPRPRNLCLDCSKLDGQAGLPRPGLNESLIRFRQQREMGYVRLLRDTARHPEPGASGVQP